MDTDRVINLLQLRRKVLTMHGNITQADPVDDSISVGYAAANIELSGGQFAQIKPMILKSLNDLVYEIDHQLLGQGVEIK